MRNTEQKNAPISPVAVTTEFSANDTVVAASTRGAASAWIGLMPITRSASSSSRMVRAPRSAHMAVAPAPATTKTVTIGALWFTVKIAQPVPEKSAAPMSVSKTLKRNPEITAHGIVINTPGSVDTRATNQH
ncbi:Uncharacterised protein [Mycobacterium tuberculosis]|nr:Uncharacterised protein [Mycobacterium tuberculosis]CKT41708.1 Uncharacterised protein [Mycobacterium tuberculosis]